MGQMDELASGPGPWLLRAPGSATIPAMQRLAPPRPRLSLCIAPLLLAGCQGIAEAPADMPRVEVEVDVAVEPAFLGRLLNADAGLQQAIEEAVLAEADVGLRFYPVLARSYTDGQTHPTYKMSVLVRELVLDVQPREGDTPPRLKRLAATTSVAIEKRRPNAPALMVAQSRMTGDGPTRSDAKGTVEASYQATGIDSEAAPIERGMIVSAVQTAFRQSCRSMLPAIDREFAGRPAGGQ
jgi:hypothetical protein